VLLDDASAAERSHRSGVRRLLARRGGEALRHHVDYLPALETMERQFAPLGSPERLRELLADSAVSAALEREGDAAMPRDAVALASLARRLEPGWFDAVRIAGERIAPALESFAALDATLSEPHPPAWSDAIDDVRREVARLVARDLLGPRSDEGLEHLPRRLASLRSRVRRLPGGLDRDRRLREERDAILSRLAELSAAGLDAATQGSLEDLLEEHRVHLFAGDIRTAFPAGAARVDEAIRNAAASLGRT
jgi:ATP-dependent helicase HrpA